MVVGSPKFVPNGLKRVHCLVSEVRAVLWALFPHTAQLPKLPETSLVKSIPRFFTLLDAVVNEIIFLISFSICF